MTTAPPCSVCSFGSFCYRSHSHFYFLSLSFFISVLLLFSHHLACCALYNFLLHESLCLLFHRRRGFVKSTWISSILWPIIPLFLPSFPSFSFESLFSCSLIFHPGDSLLLLKVVCFTNQSPTCHSRSLSPLPSISVCFPHFLIVSQFPWL